MTRAAAVLVALAFATPMAAAAQQVTPAPTEVSRTISLSATGTVLRAPDQAIVSLAVQTQAATAREASQLNARRMQAVVRALRQAGIPAEHIRTQSYSLEPRYEYPKPGRPGEQKLVGYTASNTVRVQVDTIGRVGATLDAALAAGANRAMGISYQLRDPEAARREALRRAVANAREDARALAEAAGLPLGPLLQLSTEAFPPRPVPLLAAARGFAQPAAPAVTPVEPGQMEVVATVSAVFRLGAAPGEVR